MMAELEGKILSGGASVKSKQESKMKTLINRFMADEDGATAIEYGLIAALIAVAIIAAVKSVGQTLSGTFNSIDSGLTG